MGYTVTYTSSTLYARTPIVGRFLDFYKPVLIPPDISDELIVVKRQDWVHRPDNMAFDHYNNEMLFWVFGVRNGLKDLIFDIKYGSVLFVPTSKRLIDLKIGGTAT